VWIKFWFKSKIQQDSNEICRTVYFGENSSCNIYLNYRISFKKEFQKSDKGELMSSSTYIVRIYENNWSATL
jgi:hypothetical protein